MQRSRYQAVAHEASDFLPWHRAYLQRFANELRNVILAPPTPVPLVYWDWMDPESTAAVFADDFMGKCICKFLLAVCI
jgi:hypothetical protein